MVGRQYYVEFPTMSFYLHFVSDQALEFIVEKTPDLPKGSAHAVNITIELLRDEIYGVVAGERKHTVHIEDFKEHRVHAFLTIKDLTFIRHSAPLGEVSKVGN